MGPRVILKYNSLPAKVRVRNTAGSITAFISSGNILCYHHRCVLLFIYIFLYSFQTGVVKSRLFVTFVFSRSSLHAAAARTASNSTLINTATTDRADPSGILLLLSAATHAFFCDHSLFASRFNVIIFNKLYCRIGVGVCIIIHFPVLCLQRSFIF